MTIEYYKALKRLYFPEVKQTISPDRYFYFEAPSIMVPMPNGNIVNFGSDLKRLSFLKSSDYLLVVSKEEYATNPNSGFKPRNGVSRATFNDTVNIASTVPEDNRFQVIDAQKPFERSLPIKTEQFLNNGLPSANSPLLTKVTEVSEKYQRIDVTSSVEIKLPTIGEELEASSPAGSLTKSLPLVPMDIPIVPRKNTDYEKSWETFKSFTKKGERLDFLKAMSYPSVLGFMKEKLESCIESGDILAGEHKQINLEKQYNEFISLLDKKISQFRAELKM